MAETLRSIWDEAVFYALALSSAAFWALVSAIVVVTSTGWATRLLWRHGRLPTLKGLWFTFAAFLIPGAMVVMVFTVGDAPLLLIFFWGFTVPTLAACSALVIGSAVLPPHRRSGPRWRADATVARVLAAVSWALLRAWPLTGLAALVAGFRWDGWADTDILNHPSTPRTDQPTTASPEPARRSGTADATTRDTIIPSCGSPRSRRSRLRPTSGTPQAA